MKRSFFLLLSFFTCLLLENPTLHGQCANRALHFDGNDDYITVNPSPILGNADFTVEAWFFAETSVNNCTTSNCSGNFRRLFNFAGSITELEIGECSGFLNILYTGITNPIPLSTAACVRDGDWHHIAVVRNGNNLEIFLDCISVFITSAIVPQTFTLFRVGHLSGILPEQGWLGMVDEVKLWDTPLTQAEICGNNACLCTGIEPNLVLYWPMDDGIANDDNSISGGNITSVIDQTGNGYDGTLSGFELLNANFSNFVCSGVDLAYPNFNDLEISVMKYPSPGPAVSEICVGDRVNFSTSLNGQVVPGGHPVVWEVNEGGGWQPFSTTNANSYAFSEILTSNTLDCATSTDGFIDQKYRAKTTVINAALNETCEYISEEYDLRLCCPINPGIVKSSPNLICDITPTPLTLDILSSDLFIINPGPFVEIKWYSDLTGYMGPWFDNQTSINFNFQAPSISSPTDFCFEARVTNCAGKMESFPGCVSVDPEPDCQQIFGLSPSLELVATSPHLIYSICPGDDAVIGEILPIQDCSCNRNWQYSFVGVGSGWTNEGSSSNPILNTNTLPWDFNWQSGVTSIFYRIECNPLSDPSGCATEYSAPIEIQLKTAPPADFIVGLNQICIEDLPASFTVNNYNSAYDYTWFCDGLEVGTGQFFTADKDKSACYEVAISNGCQTIVTPLHCLEVCEMIPIISCPVFPNECACLGDPITLAACDSEFNCGSNLIYLWTVDGVPQISGPNCTITHTPLIGGSTYEVTVYDLTTGCSASTSKTIIPCDKQ